MAENISGWLVQEDWTYDPLTKRTNNSTKFVLLVDEVARLIRGSAHALIGGDSQGVARLIVAQLAHVHHLVPKEEIDQAIADKVEYKHSKVL